MRHDHKHLVWPRIHESTGGAPPCPFITQTPYLSFFLYQLLMDIVFSNSTLLFRQPSPPPVRTVASPLSIFAAATTSSNSNHQLWLRSRSRTKLSFLSTNDSKLPKFSISCGASSSSAITEINESEFPNTVLKSDRLVLVEFVANWCGPCRLIAPAIEWLAQVVYFISIFCVILAFLLTGNFKSENFLSTL